MSEAELNGLKQRVLLLEKGNRRHLAAWAVLAVAATLLACADHLPGQPRVIEAREFVVVDGAGNKRASLSATEAGGRLRLYLKDVGFTVRPEGDERGVGNHIELGPNKSGTGMFLALYGPRKQQELRVDSERGVSLDDLIRRFQIATPEASLWLKDSQVGLSLESPDRKGSVELRASNEGINLTLKDSKGFSSVIGITPLVTPTTGETHKTSAASFVMFDKDGNGIWRAP